jgi:hypothetical protein
MQQHATSQQSGDSAPGADRSYHSCQQFAIARAAAKPSTAAASGAAEGMCSTRRIAAMIGMFGSACVMSVGALVFAGSFLRLAGLGSGRGTAFARVPVWVTYDVTRKTANLN